MLKTSEMIPKYPKPLMCCEASNMKTNSKLSEDIYVIRLISLHFVSGQNAQAFRRSSAPTQGEVLGHVNHH